MSSRPFHRPTCDCVVRLFHATLLTCLLIPAATTAAAAEETPTAGQPKPADSNHGHFLYLRNNQDATTSLVLAKITPEGFEQCDLLAKRNLDMHFTPLCAYSGKVYVLVWSEVIEIDVATGAAIRICPQINSYTYHSGRLYTLVSDQAGRVCRVFDLSSRTYRDVCTVDVGPWDPPVALSPDGKRLAFFSGLHNTRPPSQYRLATVDLQSGAVKQIGPSLFSMVFVSGGGPISGEGPPFVWLDTNTILLVRDESDLVGGLGRQPVPAGGGPMRGGGARWDDFLRGTPRGTDSEPLLAILDVDTEKMTDVLKLPRFARNSGEPYLRPLGGDGVPRIVVGHLGQYRIDLKTKQLTEDNTLAGEFQWVRGPQPERLLFGKTELHQAQSIPEVSVSPDGRTVVWLTGMRGQLRCYTAGDNSPRTVAEGSFATLLEEHRRPEKSILLWIDSNDLEPVEHSEPPSDSKPFDEEPWG